MLSENFGVPCAQKWRWPFWGHSWRLDNEKLLDAAIAHSWPRTRSCDLFQRRFGTVLRESIGLSSSFLHCGQNMNIIPQTWDQRTTQEWIAAGSTKKIRKVLLQQGKLGQEVLFSRNNFRQLFGSTNHRKDMSYYRFTLYYWTQWKMTRLNHENFLFHYDNASTLSSVVVVAK